MPSFDIEVQEQDWEALLRVSGPIAEERLRSIALQRMLQEALVELESVWSELTEDDG